MKNNQVVKFGLSVVAAAVLAACSSGGSGNGAADAAAKQQQEAAAQQAAEAAKKAEDAAAQQAAEAAKKAEDAAAAEAAKVAAKDNNRQGAKFVKKTQSDFEIGLNEAGAKTSTSQGNQSDMVVKLHRSLDTVVVATNTADTSSTNKIGYLEDYDFRKASQSELEQARDSGETTLSHININGSDKVERAQVQGEKRIVNGLSQIEEEAIRIRNNTADTKTTTKGAEEGSALVYQTDRTNYIGTDEKVVGNNTDIIAREDHRERAGTVTEVYGHRTFVLGNAETGEDADTAKANDGKVNAPFQYLNGSKAAGAYAAGTLNKVQYGRVTSQLDVESQDTAGVKEGVAQQSNNNGTLVVKYDTYNNLGSENNYFYRGVDATAGSSALLADLGNYYGQVGNSNEKAGSLTYQGHAVTYGIEHKAPAVALPDAGRVPNALYGQVEYQKPVLVSGTHVTANIDLATRDVTGSLYDVWALGHKEGENVTIFENTHTTQDIATFKGTLANSGEIDGTSARTQDGAAGSFNANLYGVKADELGGGLASTATDAANSWGAVFGAKVQNPVHTTATPVEVKPNSPWSVQTDEVNK